MEANDKAGKRGGVFLPHEGDAPTLALAGFGTIAFVVGMIRGSWLLRLLGLAVAGAGWSLYARGKLAERSSRIDEASSTIRSELEDLDPVARAQVLTDIAKDQIS